MEQTDGNSTESTNGEAKKQSPLTRELGATRRIIEILEELPEPSRKRVLAHASDYISTPHPTVQQDMGF